MKNLFSSILALTMGVTASVAQIPGMMSMPSAQPLEGTSLGANETVSYDGIALGNRVKLRGYVDFIYSHDDYGSTDDTKFSTAGDVDFLVDFSPVTGEVHLAYASGASQPVTLEQVFGRYSFNQDFNLSFGRQLTNLGYEADEAPGLYAVTNAYKLDTLLLGPIDVNARRNYVDGLRANFNNGQFGLSLGVHDGYWVNDDFNDNIAIDLAASVMIVPGLEARLGYAHQDHKPRVGDENIDQFNAWLAYNPGDLTLAFEFDIYDIYGDELWDIMLLANYQFVDWFGATFRYTHEDLETISGAESEVDRFTLALLFSLSQNLFLNLEYSHSAIDSALSDDINEFRIEGLLTF
jgi:hypothetical protein